MELKLKALSNKDVDKLYPSLSINVDRLMNKFPNSGISDKDYTRLHVNCMQFNPGNEYNDTTGSSLDFQKDRLRNEITSTFMKSICKRLYTDLDILFNPNLIRTRVK